MYFNLNQEKNELPAPFERTGNKNRASERYHIPHKKAVKVKFLFYIIL